MTWRQIAARIGLPPYNPLGGWPPNPHFFAFRSGLSEGARPFSGVRGPCAQAHKPTMPRFARQRERLIKRARFLWRRFKRRRR
jgi:hypothetical protein